MYKIGDKIVYPLYGAGIISDIETTDIDGEAYTYYVLTIPIGNLSIRISAAKAESLGVRPVLPKEALFAALEEVLAETTNMPDNWNHRYKENMERIKSGILKEIAVVYSSLQYREGERGLSTAEKKMMTTAKQIILTEIITSLDIPREAAETTLEDIFPVVKK